MNDISNIAIYAAWLKDKNRKQGDIILDCLHVAADDKITETDIKEYVLKRIKERSAQFSIGEVPVENIIVEIVRLAILEKGHIDIGLSCLEKI